MSEYRCFFADRDAGPCSGALVRAHLLPRSLLRRVFPHGAVKGAVVWRYERPDGSFRDGERWRPLTRLENRDDLPFRSLKALIGDPRIVVPCCGGIVGNGGHHGRLDQSRTLRIPRADLPEGVEQFAEEMGLVWWVEREYGPLTPLDQIGRAA